MLKTSQEETVSSVATIILKKANDTVAEDMLDCDAVVFGTPNYCGYEAGMLNDFFNRTFFPLRGKVDEISCAIFGSAIEGGTQALDSLA